MSEFDAEEFKRGYRCNHLNIEWSINDYINANLATYDDVKERMIANITWQINYLIKQKEMLNK